MTIVMQVSMSELYIGIIPDGFIPRERSKSVVIILSDDLYKVFLLS